jgi:hypothetical protein
MSTQDSSTESQETGRDAKAKLWAEADEAEATGKSLAAEPTKKEVADPAAAQKKPAAEEAASTSATASEADPYDGLPQGVRDEIVGLKSMLAQTSSALSKTTERLRNTEGHIGGLKSQIDEIRKSAPAATKSGAPSAAEVKAAQGSAEAMSKLKADYPEFGSALEAALEERLAGIGEAVAKATTPAAQPANVVTREELQATLDKKSIDDKHPGWGDLVRTPAFAGWLERQPAETKALAASASPQDAIRLLDLHAEASTAAVPATKTKQRLDAAAAIPTGRGGAGIRQKSLDNMSKAELWAYYDEQDRLARQQAA